MATDKNRIMISLDDKNLEKLENLVEDARDRRGMRLTKSQVIELLLNTVDYFDDIMGAIYSKIRAKLLLFFTNQCNTSDIGVMKWLFILDKVNYQVRFQLINTMLK